MLLRLRNILRRLPPEEFKSWANDDPDRGPVDMIMYWRRPARGGENLREFTDPHRLRDELISNPHEHRHLSVGNQVPQGGGELGDLLFFEPQDTVRPIELEGLSIDLWNQYKSMVRVDYVLVRKMRISQTMKPVFQISNCWIELLILTTDQMSLDIIDSHIACLELRRLCLKNLTVKRSSLSAVQSAVEIDRSVGGDVKLDKLITPRGGSWYRKRTSGADQWGRVRKHLVLSGNEWAAGIFHATEMSLRSREDSSRLVRGIGKFYEDACDYGNSIGKPICWMVLFFFLFWGAYLALEPGSHSAVPEAISCVGWIRDLCGEGSWAAFWRTLYLSAQPIVNPLAGITGPSVVTPGRFAYLLSIVHRVLSLVLIFLVIVAIRRRFRLTVE